MFMFKEQSIFVDYSWFLHIFDLSGARVSYGTQCTQVNKHTLTTILLLPLNRSGGKWSAIYEYSHWKVKNVLKMAKN